MAKMKLDVKKIKELLTSRYEILAVAVAGCLVVFCLIWGLSTLLSASSPEPGIRQSIAELENQRANAPKPPPNTPKRGGLLYDWPPVTAALARPSLDSWFEPNAAGASARVNPRILAMDSDAEGKAFQIDYIPKGIHTYEVNPTQEKLTAFTGGASPVPVLLVAAKRLVVVSGTFPYYEQAELYRKALRAEKIEELFKKGYAPTMEGLNVERRRITFKDGKEEAGKWEALYMYDDATGIVKVAAKIEKMLKTAVIDDHQGEKYRDVIHGMSVTPLPKLAGKADHTDYPEIRLPAVFSRLPQVPPAPKKKDNTPPVKAGVGDERPLGPAPVRVLPHTATKDSTSTKSFADLQEQSLKDQLSGNINWFSPFGTPAEEPPKRTETADPKAATTHSDVLEPMINYKARNVPPVNHKALIRFVDVDLEPGVVFQYRVQVRFANPNYKQPVKLLAHSGMAEIKELTSDWVETPMIAIPRDSDYKFYITNQERGFVSRVVSVKAINTGAKTSIADRFVPFEVFRFVDTVREKEKTHFVADWVVAERLFVARGEPIGRECDVEIAVWNKLKTQWEIGGSSTPKVTGLAVDFRSDPAIVLLDFTGGTQNYKNPKTGFPGPAEESETEALLLMPDLTMKLRNSREDNDELNSPPAQERAALFELWQTRLEELRAQAKAPPPKGAGK